VTSPADVIVIGSTRRDNERPRCLLKILDLVDR